MDMALQKELQVWKVKIWCSPMLLVFILVVNVRIFWSRKRGGNASFVKMRLFVQLLGQYTSGAQSENAENVWLFVILFLIGFVDFSI